MLVCGGAGEALSGGHIKQHRRIMLHQDPQLRQPVRAQPGCLTPMRNQGVSQAWKATGMLFAVDLVWAVTCHGHTLPGFGGHLPPWVPALGGKCSLPSCIVFSYEEPMGREVRNRDWFVSKILVSVLHENSHIFEKNKSYSPSSFQITTSLLL